MEHSEKTLRHFFQINRTLTQMLLDRGYLFTPADQNMDFEQFCAKYGGYVTIREAMMSLHINRDDPTDQIFVFFSEGRESQRSGLSVKDVNLIVEKMRESKVGRSIIVYRDKVSFQARQLLQMLKDPVVELFSETELLINLTQHKLVPQHIVLSADQKRELLDKYRLNEAQLPRIQKNDPVARYYGLARLQVVKIVRDSETAGKYVTYRIVW